MFCFAVFSSNFQIFFRPFWRFSFVCLHECGGWILSNKQQNKKRTNLFSVAMIFPSSFFFFFSNFYYINHSLNYILAFNQGNNKNKPKKKRIHTLYIWDDFAFLFLFEYIFQLNFINNNHAQFSTIHSSFFYFHNLFELKLLFFCHLFFSAYFLKKKKHLWFHSHFYFFFIIFFFSSKFDIENWRVHVYAREPQTNIWYGENRMYKLQNMMDFDDNKIEFEIRWG